MDEFAGKLKLKGCRHCGRTFVPESLVKHESNCQNIQKKRKVFDTSKQRVTEDLSLKQIKQAQKKAQAEHKKQSVQPSKSHWRQKHEEFIRNIRAAKISQDCMDRGAPLPPPPPPSENPDYVTCPHCNRRFNEKAADRHISFCKEQQKRISSKREPTAQEKARAAAKGYQAPRPKGRGQTTESPSYGNSVGSSRGGYSNTPPAARGGYSNASPAARGSTKQEPSRTPVGGTGYGGRGRAAGGATRGRPSPSGQQTYQASDYTDYESQYSDLDSGDLKYGNGRVLRTGRDIQSYQDARREVRGQNPVPRTSTRGGMAANRLAPTKTSGPTGRAGDSGYYSNSDGDNKSIRKGAPSKFCHECGNKYPVEDARFCCECGIKRMGLAGR